MNQITQSTENPPGLVTAFEYDGHPSPTPSNGNLINDGRLKYQYDTLNRLIAVYRVSDGLQIAAYYYDAGNRWVRKTITNGGVTGNIPNGTTDYLWFGWQVIEERNPFGGSGSTDAPTKQYVWGVYIDECIQMTTLVVLGPQSLPIGVYYLLQDLLYRAVALTNSSGNVVEAYDCDPYGNTLIFTGPGADGLWFTDDDVQSSYGTNEVIFQGRQYDPETQLYYFRTRYYVPTLGRFVGRNPGGYIQGRYDLYDFCDGNPVVRLEPFSIWIDPVPYVDPDIFPDLPPDTFPDGYTGPNPIGRVGPDPIPSPIPPPIPPVPISGPLPVPKPAPQPTEKPKCRRANCYELNKDRKAARQQPYIYCGELPYPDSSMVPNGHGYPTAIAWARHYTRWGHNFKAGPEVGAESGDIPVGGKYVHGWHAVAKNTRTKAVMSLAGGPCCEDTSRGPMIMEKWIGFPVKGGR